MRKWVFPFPLQQISNEPISKKAYIALETIPMPTPTFSEGRIINRNLIDFLYTIFHRRRTFALNKTANKQFKYSTHMKLFTNNNLRGGGISTL